MTRGLRWMCLSALGAALMMGAATAADAPKGLNETGKPDLKSAGPVAFGPKGVLFVGDPQGAQVFAIGVGDAPTTPIGPDFSLEGTTDKVAALLGTEAADIRINDMAIEPGTGVAYLSVSRGTSASAEPAIVRIDGKGNVTALSLDNVPYAKVTIANAPAAGSTDRRGGNQRLQSITDLKFVDGRLYIAGLSNEEFASKLRSIPFPFTAADTGASVEILHTAHGAALETRSPVRTFVPFMVGGEAQILAAYTCTPLVTFPVSNLKPGEKVRGRTIAELGNRNTPLDMIVYEKGGKQYLLLANDRRGVMKISTEGVEKQNLTEAVTGGGTAGLNFETVESLQDVKQLDKLSDTHAVVYIENDTRENSMLKAVALP